MLLPFLNPPFVALGLVWLSYLPFVLSYKVFVLGVVANLFVLVVLCYRVFPKVKSYAYLSFLIFLFFPVIETIRVSQLSIFLATIVLLVYAFLKEKKDLYAGLVLGLLFVKPQYLLLLPFAFIMACDKRMFVKGFLITFATVLLLSIVVSDIVFPFDYLAFLSQTDSPDFGNRPWRMFTLMPILYSLGLQKAMTFLVNGALYLLVLLVYGVRYLSKMKSGQLGIFFAVSVVLTVFFSLHVLVHDLVIFVVPILILFERIINTDRKSRKALLISVIMILFLLPYVSLLGQVGWLSLLPLLSLILI
jgi:hypothetical protein